VSLRPTRYAARLASVALTEASTGKDPAVNQSSPRTTALASGQVNASDAISVELVSAGDTPPAALVYWPPRPSVTSAADPRALARLASTVVRVLAEAQAQLSKVRLCRTKAE
jgi:hypothetical protein